MLDSIRKRWLLGIAIAVVAALAITAVISLATRPKREEPKVDGSAIWKARTGVDLAVLPRMHRPRQDSKEARELDKLLEPLDLRLGGRTPQRRRLVEERADIEALDQLRDYLRSAIKAGSTEAVPVPSTVAGLIQRHDATLDSVADYVDKHRDIRWVEHFGPRERRSALYTDEHLTLHRLLIGRAFLALERGDPATAKRMLHTSQQLNRLLAERWELQSQSIAIGVERLQLALMRHAGSAMEVNLTEPTAGLRERYLTAISAEAALTLANARLSPMNMPNSDPPDRFVRLIAGVELEKAANEAVALAAEATAEIHRSQDGCIELSKIRRRPTGFFAGDFYTLNPTEAWRRYVVLALDRAITAAVLTGRTSSPCPSVMISVRDEASKRTVEVKGLPPESENVIGVPAVVTTQLKRPETDIRAVRRR